MSTNTISTAYKGRLVANFIKEQLNNADLVTRPLLVSMQGPQGAGKSTLAAELVNILGSEEKPLRCAVASLDDFYHTHADLRRIADAHPSNAMLRGRGPPGTHDIDRLNSTVERLRSGLAPSPENPVTVPVFDKSLFNGEGDRSTSIVAIESPVDVFILEGWSLGYAPLDATTAKNRWEQGRVAQQHPYASIRQINENLAEFDSRTADAFDCHIAIRPLSYDYVYVWRLEQEHQMRAANGGKGMSDEAVKAFVDRYMPVYEVFGDTEPPRATLKLIFGQNREVICTDT